MHRAWKFTWSCTAWFSLSSDFMSMSFCFDFLSSSSRSFSRSLFLRPSSLACRDSWSSCSRSEKQLGQACECEAWESAKEGGWVGVRAFWCCSAVVTGACVTDVPFVRWWVDVPLLLVLQLPDVRASTFLVRLL